MTTPQEILFYYHERTKHRLDAYAKGPGSLDWRHQPDPFRRFAGCETVALPTHGLDPACRFGDLDRTGAVERQPFSLQSAGLLFELAFGLSAWKQYGSERWALRCNPSSGNLHPTEAYALCADAGVLPPGVYHYQSYHHRLERRGRFTEPIENGGLYIGLSSIHWREAWKYGERAFRYCQHDAGHALAALSYAAACLGWTAELCGEAGDAEIAAWLGLDRADDFVEHEREEPDFLCRLRIDTGDDRRPPLDRAALNRLSRTAEWRGKAERLSPRHSHRWPIIDEAGRAAQKPAGPAARFRPPALTLPPPRRNPPAGQLIRARRSAQRFNARAQALAIADFHRLMLAVLPNARPPFTAWNWRPAVHLLLFVHRVEQLDPGLYLMPRDAAATGPLRQAASADFAWRRIDAPYELYRLAAGAVGPAAKTVSCHQSIASDGYFSLGMLASFARPVSAEPWRYRRLFWECGLIGQILYLEAEAAGARGTGIGCFFDDAVHGILGLRDNAWQSLYHFTVGDPVEDTRLQTLPAYAHLTVTPDLSSAPSVLMP